MVQVSQEQKRVIKKFVHVGFDIGTLAEYDVWNIHYSLTRDNVAIPAKERPKSAKTLSREVWAYRDGLSTATFLCLSGMWRVRCIARETVNVLDSGIMKRLDTETDAEFTKVVDGLLANDDYIIREQWPNALVENTDIWYPRGDGMNEEWQSLVDRLYLEQADKRHAEYEQRVAATFVDAIRKAEDDDRSAFTGVCVLAGTIYAHWHFQKRLATLRHDADNLDPDDWGYFSAMRSEQHGMLVRLLEHGSPTISVSKALTFLVPAYTRGIAPDYSVFK